MRNRYRRNIAEIASASNIAQTTSVTDIASAPETRSTQEAAMSSKTKQHAASKRSSVATDPWNRAVRALAEAKGESERERAFAELVAEASRTLPGLTRHGASLLALVRSAGIAESLTEELAGEPRIVVDEVELPRFDPVAVLAESAVRAQVHARVYETELLTGPAVSRLLGSRSKNPRQLANRRRVASRLLGVPHRNQYLYPSFQIDSQRARVYEAAEKVNMLLCAADDPWGVASWWLAPNGRLGGVAPADLLGDEEREQEVVELAESLAEDDAA